MKFFVFITLILLGILYGQARFDWGFSATLSALAVVLVANRFGPNRRRRQ